MKQFKLNQITLIFLLNVNNPPVMFG